MRIGLNLLHALPEIGGGWNYIEQLVAALAEHDGGHQFVAFCSPHSVPLVPDGRAMQRVVLPVESRSRWARIRAEHGALVDAGRRHAVELMHHFSGTMPWRAPWRNVVTVYDLLPLREPRAFPLAKRLYLRAMVPRSLRAADMLAPMSEATATDVATLLGVARERMVVVPAVLGGAFVPAGGAEVARLRRRHALPERFWLYVAHAYPHKNHRRLLEAFAATPAGDAPAWPLVLRGDGIEEALAPHVAELGLAERVRFLPRLDGADMATLFSAASGLAFPSLFEGAGIPVLEAMACGCPVVASGIAPLREFGGDVPDFCDASDVGVLRAALQRLEAEPARRATMRARGLARAERFRPAPVAAACHRVYELAARADRAVDPRALRSQRSHA
ncbi:MAG TPA: glycosyltransferase family 1 protein [Gemmatirosa sp.]|nr:glycosyltransferase family 1 protein [Gemmatirosa sp.]